MLVLYLSPAQSVGPAPGQQARKPLEVGLQILVDGNIVRDGGVLHAPVDIYISPCVGTTVTAHKGDYIMVYLSANQNRLWSAKFKWRDAIKHTAILPLESPAGFFGGVFAWSNAPAGSYSIIATTSKLHGFSAVSSPVHITISPP